MKEGLETLRCELKISGAGQFAANARLEELEKENVRLRSVSAEFE